MKNPDDVIFPALPSREDAPEGCDFHKHRPPTMLVEYVWDVMDKDDWKYGRRWCCSDPNCGLSWLNPDTESFGYRRARVIPISDLPSCRTPQPLNLEAPWLLRRRGCT